MTCIVGVIDQTGNVIMGGDSAGVDGHYNVVIRKDPKVFRVGDMLIGMTSSFRMGNLLRFHLTPPLHPDKMDTFEYMITQFIPAVRTCLKEGAYITVKDGVESGGTWLVGYRNRLFKIENDFQVAENTMTFESVGCGAPYAMGYMWNNTQCADGTSLVTNALQCAASFSAGVYGPFTIEILRAT